MDEFIGFTAREKYILNAYRDRELSGSSRYIVWELTYIIPSLLFVSFYFWYQDITWVFVSYALLLSRVFSRLKHTLFFIESYRNIFLKYETTIKELMDVPQEGE